MTALARLGLHLGALVVALGGTSLVFAAMLIMNDEAPKRAAGPKPIEHLIEPVRAKPPAQKQRREAPRPERRVAAAKAEARAAPASVTSSLSGVDLGMPELGVGGGADLAQASGLAGATREAQALVMSESAVDAPPRAIERVQPEYPARARAEGIEGTVTVSLLVGPDGRVEKAKVVAAEPPGVFDEVALEAVRAWRFEPATYAGKPVKVWARQTVRFGLM